MKSTAAADAVPRVDRTTLRLCPDVAAAVPPTRILWFGGFMLILAFLLIAWIVFGSIL